MQEIIPQNPTKSHKIPLNDQELWDKSVEHLENKQWHQAYVYLCQYIDDCDGRASYSPTAHYNRSVALKNMGKLDEAIEDAEIAIKQYVKLYEEIGCLGFFSNPLHHKSLGKFAFLLGHLYCENNQTTEAMQYFGLASYISPEYHGTLTKEKQTNKKLKSVINWGVFYIFILCLLSILNR